MTTLIKHKKLKAALKPTILSMALLAGAGAMTSLPQAQAASLTGNMDIQIASCGCANPCNPCAAKNACNPCNPCAAKTPCNPCAAANACNPCAAKNPCNPCAAANPCAAKKDCANPCAAS